MHIRKLFMALAAGIVTACATLGLDNARPAPPSAHAIVAMKSERPLVALALGAGGGGVGA